MKTEWLYEFCVLAETLHYGRAAQALFLSQSVLTKHIQRMEAELGVKLLVRSTHGVALTEAGRLVAAQAGELLRQCSHAERQLQKGLAPTGGRLRIACSLELSYAAHIRRFLSAFMERYRGIDTHLDVLNRMPREVLDQYDLVFSPCSYFDLPPQAKALLVRRHGTCLVLPPRHPLMAQPSVGLHQLSGQTLIVPYADELFGPYAQNWQLAVRSCAHGVNHIPAPNLATALLLVSLGQGLLIAPHYVRSLVSAETFLAAVSTPGCGFSEYLYAASPGDNPAAELFFDEFVSACPPLASP